MRRERNWPPSRGLLDSGTHTTARPRGKGLDTRVDDRDSSLIAPDDTVSSGVEPQSTLRASLRSPFGLRFCPSDRPTSLREPSANDTTGENSGQPGHVSCSSIRKSTPGYLGSGPKYAARTGGFFAPLRHFLPFFFSLLFSPIDSQRRRLLLPVFITL